MSGLQNHVRWCFRAQIALTVVMVGLLVGFYLVGYRPQIARLQTLREEILARQAQLRESQSRTRVLPALFSEVKTLREQLDQAKKLPSQQELPQFLRDVTKLGQDSALRKFVVKPGMPARQALFCELPITLTFDGDFVDVFNFLRHTEQMQRLTRIRTMTMKLIEGKAGQVTVQLTMNIYFAPDFSPASVPETKINGWADVR